MPSVPASGNRSPGPREFAGLARPIWPTRSDSCSTRPAGCTRSHRSDCCPKNECVRRRRPSFLGHVHPRLWMSATKETRNLPQPKQQRGRAAKRQRRLASSSTRISRPRPAQIGRKVWVREPAASRKRSVPRNPQGSSRTMVTLLRRKVYCKRSNCRYHRPIQQLCLTHEAAI